MWWGFPAPTVLLLGGVLAGLLVALARLAASAARRGPHAAPAHGAPAPAARRWRLAVNDHVIGPVAARAGRAGRACRAAGVEGRGLTAPRIERMTRLEVPVQLRWSDMDAYAHVNNVEMLRLLEEARIEAFWSHPVGADGSRVASAWPTAVLDAGPGAEVSTLVARQEIEYLGRSATAATPVIVEMWIGHLGGASLDVCYEVRDAGDGRSRARHLRAGASPRSCSSTRRRARRGASAPEERDGVGAVTSRSPSRSAAGADPLPGRDGRVRRALRRVSARAGDVALHAAEHDPVERVDRPPVELARAARAGGTARAARTRSAPRRRRPSARPRSSSHASPGTRISARSRSSSPGLDLLDPPEVDGVVDEQLAAGRGARGAGPGPPTSRSASPRTRHASAHEYQPRSPPTASRTRHSAAGDASTVTRRSSTYSEPPAQSGSLGSGSLGRAGHRRPTTSGW